VVQIVGGRGGAELERLRAERERLGVEQRLRESEQRYRDFFEEAPLACVIIGVDRRVLSVNCRAAEWFGYTREELVGMPVAALYADTPAGNAPAGASYRRFPAGDGAAGR